MEFKTKTKFIKSTNREIVNKQEVDVYLPDYKIGIEYDGILYHSSMQAQKREERHKWPMS